MVKAPKMISMSDGVQIAVDYRPRPNAPVIMFSNSLGTDRHMWAPQLADLAPDFSLLSYDTRGHGQSDVPIGAYSVDRLSLDVMDIMDALAIDQLHFCGLSLGGMTGQRLAWRAPERFCSITLAATSAHMGPPSGWQPRIDTVLKDGLDSIVDAVIDRWFTPKLVAQNNPFVSDVRARFLSMDPVGYAGACGAVRDLDLRGSAQLNTVETLIIGGEDDPATPPEHSQFLAENTPNSRLVFLPGAHLVNLDQPDQFTKALRGFVHSVL